MPRALARGASLTTGFDTSKWCDQEVGVAIGKNIVVIPVRIELDPYGFIGKFQGISAQKKTPKTVADNIFDVVLKNPNTKDKMTRAIVNKLYDSKSYAQSTDTVKLLEKVRENLTPELIEKLKDAIEQNSQVQNAFGVVDTIKKVVKGLI